MFIFLKNRTSFFIRYYITGFMCFTCALVSIFRKRISLLRIIYYIIEMHHIFNMIDDKFLFPQHTFLRDFTCSTR